ncbi:hypothetical protein TIFTF001_003908 [Ficus carica]|uniref:Uncharacterized protein n=1 Tax=Ficus carica TaxID=3494 RepID=A0AA87ZGX7_FICCA|nr:hypothetical protein TIFTF001_003908 [Ficus carica]
MSDWDAKFGCGDPDWIESSSKEIRVSRLLMASTTAACAIFKYDSVKIVIVATNAAIWMWGVARTLLLCFLHAYDMCYDPIPLPTITTDVDGCKDHGVVQFACHQHPMMKAIKGDAKDVVVKAVGENRWDLSDNMDRQSKDNSTQLSLKDILMNTLTGAEEEMLMDPIAFDDPSYKVWRRNE